MDKWLMVEGHAEQAPDLIAAHIPCAAIQIEQPEEVDGITFPQKYAKNALRVLGLADAQWNKRRTDKNGILLLEKKEKKYVRVFLSEASRSLEKWPALERILKEYAERMGQNIEVCNNAVPYHTTPEKGTFYIVINRSPFYPRDHNYNNQEDSFLTGWEEDGEIKFHDNGVVTRLDYSGWGIPIIDNNRNVVAELLNGILYILFNMDVMESGEDVVMQKIMDQIMSLAAHLRNGISAEPRSEKNDRRARGAFSRKFERAVKLHDEIKQSANELKKLRENCEYFQEAVKVARRKEKAHQESIEHLRTLAVKKNMRRFLANEYDHIRKLKGVKDVRLNGNTSFSVLTDTVCIKARAHTREIGQFVITIYAHGKENDEYPIQFTNITRTVRSCAHPHIRTSGNFCLGDFERSIEKYHRRGQFALLVNTLLVFLQSANSSDSFCNLSDWPLKKSGKEE